MPTFPELFQGSDLSHGHWDTEKGAHTDKGAPSEADYQAHLEGTRGLGLVPIRPDGTCRFAALDIDVDTIDHRALWVKVQNRNLPLTVCRSKSGGAHLYAFFDPPMKAPAVRKLLRGWSGLLGYPKCEVFPKQDRLERDAATVQNLGSRINLPYFGGLQTTRYACDAEGPIPIDRFLETVRWYDPKAAINSELPQLEEDELSRMPPCLEALTRNGLPEGARNNGLLDFGVYYKKAFPNDWEARVRKHNQENVKPPLDERELDGVLKSLNRRRYAYLCHAEPISSRCDREACLKREYGINHRPSEEQGFYDDLAVRNLRKFDSTPPRYRVEVNGEDLELSSEELRNFQTGFKIAIFERFNLVVRPVKQDRWDRQLKEMIETMQIIQVPQDASMDGGVLVKVLEFLAMSDRSRSVEDVLKGLPYKNETKTWFRLGDLQRYLIAAKVTLESQKLYTLLESGGGHYEEKVVRGKRTTLWSYPISPGDRQTEAFTPPADHGPKPPEEM